MKIYKVKCIDDRIKKDKLKYPETDELLVTISGNYLHVRTFEVEGNDTEPYIPKGESHTDYHGDYINFSCEFYSIVNPIVWDYAERFSVIESDFKGLTPQGKLPPNTWYYKIVYFPTREIGKISRSLPINTTVSIPYKIITITVDFDKIKFNGDYNTLMYYLGNGTFLDQYTKFDEEDFSSPLKIEGSSGYYFTIKSNGEERNDIVKLMSFPGITIEKVKECKINIQTELIKQY